MIDARLAVRTDRESIVVDRVKAAYGKKYDPQMIVDSKQDVAKLLNEETEIRAIRERLHQEQQQTKRRTDAKHQQEEREL